MPTPPTARLVAALPTPLPVLHTQQPPLTGLPGRLMLTQRDDRELIVRPLGPDHEYTSQEIRFPVPWRQRIGTFAVSPDADLAVFAGVHAVRAVEPTGRVRWEVRHGCWYGACYEMHESYEEYADDGDHRYPEEGSACFSADGRLVWAHVRGPLPEGKLGEDTVDEWLVIDAVDGRVLARADARAAAAGSVHVPHPDSRRMAVSIGEGQDGAPLRVGLWDGEHLTVDHHDLDIVQIGVSPSGDRFVTVDHGQYDLTVHRTEDASVVAEWTAEEALPPHPAAEDEAEDDDGRTYWDWAGGFVDENTVMAGTAECDEEWGEVRHWLIDVPSKGRPEQIRYPQPVSGFAVGLSDGTWYTVGEAEVRVWCRAEAG